MRLRLVGYLVTCFVVGSLCACGGGGSDGPAPLTPQTLQLVTPLEGSTIGGTSVVLKGSGFLRTGSEITAVHFDDQPALQTSVVDDSTIVCVTPHGSVGPAVVTLFAGPKQTAVLWQGFRYIAAVLYAADGPMASTPNLYRVDLDTRSMRLIGPTGFPLRALASAGDGLLFGIESGPAHRLIALQTLTGTGAAISILRDAVTDAFVDVLDLAFTDGRLLGRTEDGNIVEIDPLLGRVTVLGSLGSTPLGPGMTAGDTGDIFLAPDHGDGEIYAWGPFTGVLPSGIRLSPRGHDVLDALTFQDGQLFALELPSAPSGGPGLMQIDPETGTAVRLMAVHPHVEAIAAKR